MASNQRRKVNEEQRKQIAKDLAASAARSSNRPRTWRELGMTTLKNLPANIGMVQSLMKAVNWKLAQEEVLQGLNNTVVIVGQPNTGKSTLFNRLKGQKLSEVSDQAGTTKTLVQTDFGPFRLIDTPGVDSPGQLSTIVQSGLQQASVVVFLMDATRGLQDKDKELYDIIQKMEKPTILAVNKIDALKGTQSADQLATDIAVALGTAGVIPVSARTGANIAEELIPDIIEASPEAALVIGRELPAFRRKAAQRIIRNSTLVSLAAGIEPIPLIDIPILLGTQIRLVLRLAALYGEPINTPNALGNVRELVTTMVAGLGMRYLAEQAAKAVPFGGDFIAGAIAGAATWSIGEIALEYYEGNKRVNVGRLRELYTSTFNRLRRGRSLQALQEQVNRQEIATPEQAPVVEPPTEEVKS